MNTNSFRFHIFLSFIHPIDISSTLYLLLIKILGTFFFLDSFLPLCPPVSDSSSSCHVRWKFSTFVPTEISFPFICHCRSTFAVVDAVDDDVGLLHTTSSATSWSSRSQLATRNSQFACPSFIWERDKWYVCFICHLSIKYRLDASNIWTYTHTHIAHIALKHEAQCEWNCSVGQKEKVWS